MSRKTNGNKAQVAAAEVKHPLMEFVPITFESFNAWLARWNQTTYLAEKLGLLHSLTTKNGWWQEPELICFLLSIADGCYTASSFTDDDPYGYERQTREKNRRSIAEKAYSVLCLKFFQGCSRDVEEPLWWWMLKHEVLFQKVLWFLRPNKGFRSLRNFSDVRGDHQQEIFRSFMQEFSQLGWKFRYPERARRWNKETETSVKQRLVAARPQLIDVLRELGKLSWLNGKDIELDAESVKKLTEVALDDTLFLPPEQASYSPYSLRQPQSLEEAVLGGSIAAEVVLLHQIKEKERRRIGVLYEASMQQHLAEQKIQKLKEIEEEKQKLDAEARDLAEQRTPNIGL